MSPCDGTPVKETTLLTLSFYSIQVVKMLPDNLLVALNPLSGLYSQDSNLVYPVRRSAHGHVSFQ